MKRAEILADGVVHAVGLVAAASGAAALLAITLIRQDYAGLTVGLVYSAALISMLAASALYNLNLRSERRGLLQSIDQSAIFGMIAGSYTPFTILYLEPGWAIAATAGIWGLASLSVALRIFRPDAFRRVSIALYLGLGWLGLALLGPLVQALQDWMLVLLVAGGILYSVGVIFHRWESLPFQSAIWHGFVVAAASVHFAAIAGGLATRSLAG